MDFSDALKAMKEGKKVRRPSMNKGWYVFYNLDPTFTEPFNVNLYIYVKGDISDWEEYSFHTGDIETVDWEIVEDIPEVKIETVSNDYFTCPQCKKHNEYLSTDLKITGCVRCGQKIKPIKDIKITYNLSEQYSFADEEWKKILPDWINIFELQQKKEKRLNNQDTFNEYLPNYNIDKPSKHKAFICKTPRY